MTVVKSIAFADIPVLLTAVLKATLAQWCLPKIWPKCDWRKDVCIYMKA